MIVGTQRFGTTLLCKILSAHTHMFVQNETWFPGVLKSDNLAPELLEPALRSFLSKQSASSTGIADYLWLGLKDPLLSYYPDHLRAFLEFGKVINIVRDPRGVVSSYIDNAWGLGTNVFTGALRWRGEVGEQLALGERSPRRVLTLKYEDLIADMEGELRKICAFLELPFDDSMLQYDKQKGPIRATTEQERIQAA
ncbi:sulfotransferase [Congregibacter sp.]|nr:sulfotransferase [Congregibacter sp.]MDA8962015.1 sulfotransferase [Congregibacter sp.]